MCFGAPAGRASGWAGINFGDGCWEGHVIEFCDVFDTVKETGDHRSFNSWGRDRGYRDLDGGSTNYRIYNNLCLRGGIKNRDGFCRVVENNIKINCGFDPHCWYKHSQDIVRRNIMGSDHYTGGTLLLFLPVSHGQSSLSSSTHRRRPRHSLSLPLILSRHCIRSGWPRPTPMMNSLAVDARLARGDGAAANGRSNRSAVTEVPRRQ